MMERRKIELDDFKMKYLSPVSNFLYMFNEEDKVIPTDVSIFTTIYSPEK